MFSFLACKNVSVKDNQLQGEVLGKNILLEQMTAKDLKISPANKLTIVKDQKAK
jgi:hypothetical protein